MYTFYFTHSVAIDLWFLPVSFQYPGAPDLSPYRRRALASTQHAHSRAQYWLLHHSYYRTRRQQTEPVARLDAQPGYCGSASLTGTLVLPALLSQLPISFVDANDVIFKVGKTACLPLPRFEWAGRRCCGGGCTWNRRISSHCSVEVLRRSRMWLVYCSTMCFWAGCNTVVGVHAGRTDRSRG